MEQYKYEHIERLKDVYRSPISDPPNDEDDLLLLTEPKLDSAYQQVHRNGLQTAPFDEFISKNIKVDFSYHPQFKMLAEHINKTTRMYRNGYEEFAPINNGGFPAVLEKAPGQRIILTSRGGEVDGGYCTGWEKFEASHNSGVEPHREL